MSIGLLNWNDSRRIDFKLSDAEFAVFNAECPAKGKNKHTNKLMLNAPFIGDELLEDVLAESVELCSHHKANMVRITKREHNVSVWATPAERERLDKVAKFWGVSTNELYRSTLSQRDIRRVSPNEKDATARSKFIRAAVRKFIRAAEKSK